MAEHAHKASQRSAGRGQASRSNRIQQTAVPATGAVAPVLRLATPSRPSLPAESVTDWTPVSEGLHADEIHQAARAGTQTPAQGLPFAEQIQRSFGRYDVSQVQAHLGSEATATARAMQAQAFATGNHVVFAGSPSLRTAAHEAAHVVQQRGGVQLKDGVGAVSDSYEQHADAVAERVVAGRSAEDLLAPMAGAGPAVFEGPVQREWVPVKDDLFQWSKERGGLTWYFRSGDRKMSFQITGEELLGSKYEELAGEWRPYSEWLTYWYRNPMPEQVYPKVDNRPLDQLDELGKGSYSRALSSKKRALDPRSKAARDAFFQEYYATDVDGTSVKTGFKPTPEWGAKVKMDGVYNNAVEGGGSTFKALHNYTAPDGMETYYEPTTKQPTKINNSEVVYQQWKASGAEAPLRQLVRYQVSGSGRATLVQIRTLLKERLGIKSNKVEVANGNPGFYAFFAVDNCKSALWLIADHGVELGIKDIASIKIDGLTLTINFEPI